MLGKEDEGSDESSEEESSEYSEESDSEAEGPRMKPVFVRKKDRLTMQQRDTQQQTTKQVTSTSYTTHHKTISCVIFFRPLFIFIKALFLL